MITLSIKSTINNGNLWYIIITEAFPAVTSPSFLKIDFNLAKLSIVVSLGCSSTSKTKSPSFALNIIGVISALKYSALFAEKNLFIRRLIRK